MIENNDYFDDLYDWIDIFDIILERKRVGQLKGIEFIIHTNEQGHNRGHIHAKYQDKEVVISIPDGRIMEGNIPPAKQKLAAEWVKSNSEFLTKKWNELTNGIKISFPGT